GIARTLARVQPRRVFLLAFAAFFLTSAAWALALPVDGTYDEKHHIVRAYAIASGRLLPDGPASDGTTFGDEGFDVPATLLPGNINCVRSAGRPPASCQAPAGDGGKGRVPSAAARDPPVYYLPVGLPLLASPDRTGVALARLVSALLSALLLAAAAATAARVGGRLLVAGVALVSTPMAMNLYGSVNPNGLEIAAGILLFTTLTAVLTAVLRGIVLRQVLVLAGVAAAIMLTLRPPLGPVLLAVDVAACALLAGRDRLAALWRDQNVRRILGASVVAGAAFTAVWTLVSGGPGTAAVPARAIHGQILGRVATVRLPF